CDPERVSDATLRHVPGRAPPELPPREPRLARLSILELDPASVRNTPWPGLEGPWASGTPAERRPGITVRGLRHVGVLRSTEPEPRSCRLSPPGGLTRRRTGGGGRRRHQRLWRPGARPRPARVLRGGQDLGRGCTVGLLHRAPRLHPVTRV